MISRPPRYTLFPYTTLFRSGGRPAARRCSPNARRHKHPGRQAEHRSSKVRPSDSGRIEPNLGRFAAVPLSELPELPFPQADSTNAVAVRTLTAVRVGSGSSATASLTVLGSATCTRLRAHERSCHGEPVGRYQALHSCGATEPGGALAAESELDRWCGRQADADLGTRWVRQDHGAGRVAGPGGPAAFGGVVVPGGERPAAGVVFLHFAAMIRGVLGTTEATVPGSVHLARVVFAGGLTGVTGITMAVIMIAGASAEGADANPVVTKAIASATVGPFLVGAMGLTASIAAAGLAILRSRVFARWIAVVALLGG